MNDILLYLISPDFLMTLFYFVIDENEKGTPGWMQGVISMPRIT